MQYENEQVTSTSNKLKKKKKKTKKGELMLSCIKPTCCKNVLHEQHGQLGFHFLMFFLKHVKETESFIFCDIKDQIFGDKKDIVSVSHLTVF